MRFNVTTMQAALATACFCGVHDFFFSSFFNRLKRLLLRTFDIISQFLFCFVIFASPPPIHTHDNCVQTIKPQFNLIFIILIQLRVLQLK